MSLTSLLSWITAAVTFGAAIMFGCLGETLNEKVGNLNLGTPGIMMMGGIGSIIGAFIYETNVASPNGIVGAICALIGCLLFSLLGGLIYSFLTITLMVNQNVVGLTLTIFGGGVANFFGGSLIKISGGVGQLSVSTTSKIFKQRIPFLSNKLGVVSELFFSYGWLVYVAIIIAIVLHYFLNHTRKGLNLRAVGENPATADACGIDVIKYKYLACLVGAMISGLGGLYYSMDYATGIWNIDGAIEAIGWLALALVIFASWKPLRTIWGSFIFGLAYWIYLYMPSVISNWLTKLLNVATITYLQNIYKAIPYILTIIVLIYVSKGKNAVHSPTSLGLSYFREDR